jgi:hypothetical protein
MPKFGKITRAEKEIKKEVREARIQAFEGLYQSLDIKEGENVRKTRDLDQKSVFNMKWVKF